MFAISHQGGDCQTMKGKVSLVNRNPQSLSLSLHEVHNAHFVLLGPNYTMEKIVCPATPLILMNPMDHPVTIANNHGFLHKGVEGKAKKLVFCHLWDVPLWTKCKTWGPGHQGLAAARATLGPLQVDENMLCNGMSQDCNSSILAPQTSGLK